MSVRRFTNRQSIHTSFLSSPTTCHTRRRSTLTTLKTYRVNADQTLRLFLSTDNVRFIQFLRNAIPNRGQCLPFFRYWTSYSTTNAFNESLRNILVCRYDCAKLAKASGATAMSVFDLTFVWNDSSANEYFGNVREWHDRPNYKFLTMPSKYSVPRIVEQTRNVHYFGLEMCCLLGSACDKLFDIPLLQGPESIEEKKKFLKKVHDWRDTMKIDLLEYRNRLYKLVHRYTGFLDNVRDWDKAIDGYVVSLTMYEKANANTSPMLYKYAMDLMKHERVLSRTIRRIKEVNKDASCDVTENVYRFENALDVYIDDMVRNGSNDAPKIQSIDPNAIISIKVDFDEQPDSTLDEKTTVGQTTNADVNNSVARTRALTVNTREKTVSPDECEKHVAEKERTDTHKEKQINDSQTALQYISNVIVCCTICKEEKRYVSFVHNFNCSHSFCRDCYLAYHRVNNRILHSTNGLFYLDRLECLECRQPIEQLFILCRRKERYAYRTLAMRYE